MADRRWSVVSAFGLGPGTTFIPPIPYNSLHGTLGWATSLCDCRTCVMCPVDRLGRRSERESPKYCDCFQWFLRFVAAEGRLVMGIMGCLGDKVVPYDASAVCFWFLGWWRQGIWDMGPWHISQIWGYIFFFLFIIMQIVC